MINTILTILFSGFFVFNQVFFFDSFTFKTGVILFPIYYYFFKNDMYAQRIYTISIFVWLELIGNSYTAIGVLIYLLIKDGLATLKKNFNIEFVDYIEILGIQLLYYLLTSNFPSFDYIASFSIFILLILVRFIRRNGYFRFNKN
jgi:hypothetical protein